MNPSKYCVKYESVVCLNPFWGLPNKKMAKNLAPIVKGVYMLNKNALTPETKMDMKKFPEHLHQWLYDFENPVQKKCFPLKTILEMAKECGKIEK